LPRAVLTASDATHRMIRAPRRAQPRVFWESGMVERREVPIARPATGEAEWRAMRRSLETGWLTQGPQVAAFERAFAAVEGAPHAVAVSSGTAGLHVALAALGVGPGDEVLVPAFTWVATANAVLYCGARPVLVDVDRATFNMDPADAAAKVTPRTRAILPVHLFGRCADVAALASAVPGIPMVCDAACAAGATCDGQPAGTLGVASVFSFHPRKVLTTGEGGMVTTASGDLAAKIKALRDHGAGPAGGKRPHDLPPFDVLGFNYRMTDLQGAVGQVQLSRLAEFVRERRVWAAYYAKHLKDVLWLRTPADPPGGGHAWQSYVCWVDAAEAPMPRNAIMDRLADMGIGTRPGTHAVHALGLYRRRFGYAPEDLPAAWDCQECSMALPMHNCLTEADVAHVVAAIRSL